MNIYYGILFRHNKEGNPDMLKHGYILRTLCQVNYASHTQKILYDSIYVIHL